MLVSICLGANVCGRDGKLYPIAIRSIARQFGDLVFSSGYSIAAVVGAGGAAKKHRHYVEKYARNAPDLDQVAIEASRVNALLLIAALRVLGVPTNPSPFESMKETLSYLRLGEKEIKYSRVAVLGGLEPNMTSDSTAAKIAVRMRSSLLIVSTRGGVFAKDPDTKLREGSRMLRSVDRSYLESLLASMPENHVFDSQTCKILLSINNNSNQKEAYFGVTGYKHISKIRRVSSNARFFTRILL
ncbi:MAG: hypothetical protein ACREBS_10300 [Nitrososphaerales archaeon]